MAATNRVHYYHAEACGFGGYLEHPLEQNITPQASLSLSSSGGYGSSREENFRLEGLLSYESAFTQVSGRMSKKEGGGWQTLSTATVEGLNILDVITADRISAQISTEHPLEGDNPKVSFLGTTFENFKIGGCSINVTLDLDICDQGNGRDYPENPCVSDERFLSRVAGQYRRMNDGKDLPEWVKDRTIPDWIRERYDVGALEEDEKSDYLITSIVKETSGKFPGRPFGNAFEIPDIGRLFLGELMVDGHTFRLTMLRVELGCRAKGSMGGPICLTNGVTKPPS
jgi:hypothetical protein